MFKKTFLLYVLVIVIAGCSSEPKVNELPITADTQVELNRVELKMQKAKEQQIDVLSPKHFASAQKALKKAHKAEASEKNKKEILHQIALADKELSLASDVAVSSHQVLHGVIEARRDAVQAHAQMNLSDEMNKADNKLMNMTEKIEKKDISQADAKRLDLEKTYRDLEMKSIKKEKLEISHQMIEQAIKEGAKNLTPETLEWAQKKVTANQLLIETNRHDTSVIETAASDARASAARLLKMVRTAKKSTAKNAEELAKLAEVNEQAALQSENELAHTESNLEKSQRKLATLSADNEKLQSAVSLDQKYETVRREFAEDEADVYKQGNKILIRLKGLSFENNKEGLRSDSFPLLAKVQKVLTSIKPNHVLIEGHTDSTGDKKLNEDLSVKRAKSVESYLVANKSIAEEIIESTGMGYAKPIATNKTMEGRAQNRRVDVIITAEE